jgi:hypothetical protein|tara:strand:+ start:1791 stop:1988 length:198 start_codon:yes stop_codon:yes gene_type:complete
MYVALIEVIENWYKGETNRRKEIHIVNAENQEQAVDKLERKYDIESSEYCVRYSIEVESINELIS